MIDPFTAFAALSNTPASSASSITFKKSFSLGTLNAENSLDMAYASCGRTN